MGQIIMLQQKTLDNGIIEISHVGIFTLEHWLEYKQTMIDLLDASDKKVYILSDFSKTERFDKEIVPEAGTAPHLTHPNLGLIVLLGGNALHNFILQITANRASKEERDSKMRVHKEYDRALETLEHFQKIQAENPEAN